ncbi:MAG: pentapeptide repeat-containing protein, partial [bacterium]
MEKLHDYYLLIASFIFGFALYKLLPIRLPPGRRKYKGDENKSTANLEHLAKLREGVELWNQWRGKDLNPSIADLSGADLSGEDLSGANLCRVNLCRANLCKANLSGANLNRAYLSDADLSEANLSKANLNSANLRRVELRGADLSEADLSEAILRNANLGSADLRGANLCGVDIRHASLYNVDLSRAEIDSQIATRGVLYARAGINGLTTVLWDGKETVALFNPDPPADSMRGRDASVAVENLKRARQLHMASMGVAVLSLGVLVGDLGDPPILEISAIGLKIPIENFVLVGLGFSAAVLTVTMHFMRHALQSIRYLRTREDAAAVGYFPWILSQYSKAENRWRADDEPSDRAYSAPEYFWVLEYEKLRKFNRVVLRTIQLIHHLLLSVLFAVRVVWSLLRRTGSLLLRAAMAFHPALYAVWLV